MEIGNAQVVTGGLGPRDLTKLRSAQDVEEFVGAAREGEVIFRSRNKDFMICLKPEVKKVIGDEVFTVPHQTKRFVNFVYRTSVPWEIEALRAAKGFGLSLDFWDHSDAVAVADEAMYQDFVVRLAQNPKMLERLKVDAGLRDFKLATRPIAPPKE